MQRLLLIQVKVYLELAFTLTFLNRIDCCQEFIYKISVCSIYASIFQAVWKMDILMSLLSFLVPNISLTGEVFRHV